MKPFLFSFLLFFSFPLINFSQSIFENPITDANPSLSNPYTNGQLVNPNIDVSGIGRSPALNPVSAKNRYDAKSWKLTDTDQDTYFEFIISPKNGKKINFISFEYTGQVSGKGPTRFAFRSSADGFANDIGAPAATGTTISLLEPNYQNVDSPIIFRLYGWAPPAGTGSYSINDFKFNGTIPCDLPEAPFLPEKTLDCTATSLELNWLPSLNATNYLMDIATDAGFSNYFKDYNSKVLGNSLTEIISGLFPGNTYYIRLKSANDCAESSFSNTIKAAPPETVYNGTWSNGLPDSSKNVRFSGNFTIDGTLEACSCLVDNGTAVLVNSEAVLKLQNALDIQGSGSLIFENNASLVQVNDAAVNTGKIIYRRISAPMKNFDFTYWSSPVKDQVLNLLSPNTLSDKYFSFRNENWVTESGSSFMNPAGKGFIIRVPKPNSIYPNGKDNWTGNVYSQPVEFVGIPNNGVIKIASEGSDIDNLIGNPYPSAIDADTFIRENAAVIGGALYFWTHNTAISQSGSFFVYNSNDYATYTLTGGTGTGTKSQNSGLNNTAPSGQIAAGQSFFVRSKATGEFVFNNAMRNPATGGNRQFFKMTKTKNTNSFDKSRIWLNLSNSDGLFKQLLVGYITGATNEFDDLYDGISFDGNSYADFYSVNNENLLTIQGRSLPFDKNDKVPLGYKTTVEGIFTIAIDKADGIFVNKPIFIKDNVTQKIHNLTEERYSFTTAKGTFNNRFVLLYEDENAVKDSSAAILGTASYEKDKMITASVNNSKININASHKTIDSVMLYDLGGRLLFKKTEIGKNEFTIDHCNSSDEFLILKVKLKDNSWVTRKIIFRN